jgi:hypothetical protein
MIQILRRSVVILAVLVCSWPAPAGAQSPAPNERVAASFLIALGRTPTPAEAGQWAKDGSGSVSDLVSRHREQLRVNPESARTVAVKARHDALGIDTATGSAVAGATYMEQVQRHLDSLGTQPTAYEQVLNRAYQTVLSRNAYTEEVEYWRKRPVVSYTMLLGCIYDWARRNQPGLMFTTGVPTVAINNPYVTAVRLSKTVASESRTAAGLPLGADAPMAVEAMRTIIAPGAAAVSSVGGITYIAAGAAGQ